MRLIGLRLVLLCGLVAPAIAIAADPPQIEREVKAALDALAGGPEPALAYEGITVRPDGGAFDVTVSGVRLAPSPDGAFDVGRVEFRVVPESDDLYEIADLRLPAKLAYRGPGGAAQAAVDIPSLTFAGTWSRRMQGFLAANLAGRDLRLRDAAGARTLSLGGLTVRIDAPDGSGRLELQGLSLRGGRDGQTLSLGRADIGLAASGFDGNAAKLDLSLDHSGLDLQSAGAKDPLVDSLLPRASALHATLAPLPGRKLLRAIAASFGAERPDNPQASKDAAAAFVSTARRLLLESGSRLRFSDMTVEMDEGRIALEGVAQADPAATLGVVSTLDAEVTGLDALIERIGALPSDSGAAQAWLLLQTLRALGAPKAAADGAVIYRYAISLRPDGALLVNGKDLGLRPPVAAPGAN